MPVTGLPVILDASLNGLLQESTISSFKIFANENGSSSVVINFAGPPCLPRRFSNCPPRSSTKSQSRQKRDKVRREEFYNNKHSQGNNTSFLKSPLLPVTQTCHDHPSLPASLISESPSVPAQSLSHIGKIDCGVVSDYQQQYPLPDQDIAAETQFIQNTATLPTPPGDRHNDVDCLQTQNNSARDDGDSAAFSCRDPNLTTLKEHMNEEMQDRIFDLRRNLRISRVAKTTSSECEPSYVVQTDDILMTVHAHSRTLESVHILEETEREYMTEREKSRYEVLNKLPKMNIDSCPIEREHIIRALAWVLKKLRGHYKIRC